MSNDPTRAAVHELRNFLTAILGFADLIERRRPDDEWVVKTAGRIRDAAQRAREATEQIGAMGPTHDEPVDGGLGRPRVLVVEEDPTLRAQVRSDLERSHFEVHDVPDGRTAVALLRVGAPRYDVIVLDWQAVASPARDVVHALHEGDSVPALIVISDAEMPPELSERHAPAPVRSWIRKPLRADELAAAVRSVLPQ